MTYKEKQDYERIRKRLGGKMLKKIIRMIICFIIVFIGVAQIERTKDLLDLAKLVASFAFGMWVPTWIK